MYLDTMTFCHGMWNYEKNHIINKEEADIVFLFGHRDVFKDPTSYNSLRAIYPNAHIIGCTSSGNILNNTLRDVSLIATAVKFCAGFTRLSIADFTKEDDLIEVSQKLVEELPKEGLKHIFILADGLRTNGSSLAIGANQAYNGKFPITGGLAGDDNRFEETWIIADDIPRQGRIAAIGFYGDTIHVSSACYAGWDEFGITRRITRAEGNTVYEIDHQPALTLYKKYLGEFANQLPSSALRFPLSIKPSENSQSVIRSIMAIDESEQSLTFAGDVPEGSFARLMKTDIDNLINGLEYMINNMHKKNHLDALGLIVSCVGRRVILDQLTDEELETVCQAVGENVQLTGFYSYGEFAPHSETLQTCQLHNQTMTITVIYEDA